MFLLLLCNDKDVLGPWVNSRKLNVFTSAVVWVLVLLSIILTASVLFPGISSTQIIGVLASGVVLGAVVGLVALVRDRRIRAAELTVPVEWLDRATWRMPALEKLSRPVLSTQRKAGLFILRGYLVDRLLVGDRQGRRGGREIRQAASEVLSEGAGRDVAPCCSRSASAR